MANITLGTLGSVNPVSGALLLPTLDTSGWAISYFGPSQANNYQGGAYLTKPSAAGTTADRLTVYFNSGQIVTGMVYETALNNSLNLQFTVTGLSPVVHPISFPALVQSTNIMPLIYQADYTYIFGTEARDIIHGGAFIDLIRSAGGADELFGGGGNDTLEGGQGADRLDGGEGIDTASYQLSNAGVYVRLYAGVGAEGDAQGDTLTSIENLTGSAFNDRLFGDDNANTIEGNSGDDSISGMAGNDVLRGQLGNDTLFGDSGNDVLSGGEGNDLLYGGYGDDLLQGDAGADVLNGGDGWDRVDYTGYTNITVNLLTGLGMGGDAQGDTLVSIEAVTTGNGNDTIIGNDLANILSAGNGNDLLVGGAGADTLYGGAGNDVLRGDGGADIINGGDGIDRADYTTSTVGVTVHLTNGTASDGDTLTGIENLYGSGFNDILIGSSVVNLFYGGTGNDQLFGLAGNDNLNGQAGDDALFGGDGNDILGGGDGADGLFGEAGNDTLYGGNGNDFVSGGDGNDVIWGDAGNDQIDAGAGNDFVILGAGNDVFTLGLGDDRVRFDYGNGVDTIRDFGNGADILDFTATNMTLAALQANTVETAAGVLMNLGSGSILLEGLHLWQVDWNSDFAFAI